MHGFYWYEFFHIPFLACFSLRFFNVASAAGDADGPVMDANCIRNYLRKTCSQLFTLSQWGKIAVTLKVNYLKVLANLFQKHFYYTSSNSLAVICPEYCSRFCKVSAMLVEVFGLLAWTLLWPRSLAFCSRYATNWYKIIH